MEISSRDDCSRCELERSSLEERDICAIEIIASLYRLSGQQKNRPEESSTSRRCVLIGPLQLTRLKLESHSPSSWATQPQQPLRSAVSQVSSPPGQQPFNSGVSKVRKGTLSPLNWESHSPSSWATQPEQPLRSAVSQVSSPPGQQTLRSAVSQVSSLAGQQSPRSAASQVRKSRMLGRGPCPRSTGKATHHQLGEDNPPLIGKVAEVASSTRW